MTEVFNIDCMEYIRSCSDNAFDLAIVDPPYGIKELTGKEVCHGRGKLKNRSFNKGADKFTEWDKRPNKKYFDELFRISKNQIIWGGNYFNLPPARCFIVWDKCQPFPNFSACEFAWTSFNMPAKIFRIDNRTGKKIHPTQKPVELYKKILNVFAQQGYKILDTHLGSGSSRIACHDAGYDFVGCEIDKYYFEQQEQRFKNHCSQLELFLWTGGKII